MPRVLNGYLNITKHYTVEYRVANGHVNGPINAPWRGLGLTFLPEQEFLNMINLPAGGTVDIRAQAHSQTSSSPPSPVFRIYLPRSGEATPPWLL